jgi:hypothetical protein
MNVAPRKIGAAEEGGSRCFGFHFGWSADSLAVAMWGGRGFDSVTTRDTLPVAAKFVTMIDDRSLMIYVLNWGTGTR